MRRKFTLTEISISRVRQFRLVILGQNWAALIKIVYAFAQFLSMSRNSETTPPTNGAALGMAQAQTLRFTRIFSARPVPRPGAGKRSLVVQTVWWSIVGLTRNTKPVHFNFKICNVTSASVCLVCSNIATWNHKCHPRRTTLVIAGIFVRDWCFTLGDETRTGRGQTRVECVSAECRQNEDASCLMSKGRQRILVCN